MTPLDAERLENARSALARYGLSYCAATAEGARAEVLVLRASSEAEEALLHAPGADRLISELRGMGFAYVALDLAPPGRTR